MSQTHLPPSASQSPDTATTAMSDKMDHDTLSSVPQDVDRYNDASDSGWSREMILLVGINVVFLALIAIGLTIVLAELWAPIEDAIIRGLTGGASS